MNPVAWHQQALTAWWTARSCWGADDAVTVAAWHNLQRAVARLTSK